MEHTHTLPSHSLRKRTQPENRSPTTIGECKTTIVVEHSTTYRKEMKLHVTLNSSKLSERNFLDTGAYCTSPIPAKKERI